MKKIVLIDPVYNPGNIPLNLGLGKIEEKLSQNPVEVHVCDFVPHRRNMNLREFQNEEKAFVERAVNTAKNAEVVYISGSHGMELKPYAIFPRISQLASAIKAANANCKIIFGGGLATFYTTVHKINPDTFKQFGIDITLSGQEQNATGPILQACGINQKPLLMLKKQDLADASSTKTGGLLGWNAWDMERYPDYISLMVQTGCPYQCSFCFEGKVYDPQNPQSTPRDIFASLNAVRERHKVNGLMIEDSIALSFPWFPHLSEELGKANVAWAIYARANELIKKSDELARAVASGCKTAIVGIESLEDSELIATDKRITARQNIEALEIAENAGLAVQGCFILGFPTDKIDDCTRRVETASKFKLSSYRWHIMQPDWSSLPEGLLGAESFTLRDHMDVQVSVPDSCLPELMESPTVGLAYDEHILIRLLSQGVEAPAALSRYGYKDQFNLRDLFNEIKPLINSINYPTNEDEMYEALFNPSAFTPR